MKGLLDPQRGRDPQVDNHCSMISPTVSSSCVVLMWLHCMSPLCLVHDTASSESLSLPASGDTAGAQWGSEKTCKGLVHNIPTELPCLTYGTPVPVLVQLKLLSWDRHSHAPAMGPWGPETKDGEAAEPTQPCLANRLWVGAWLLNDSPS